VSSGLEWVEPLRDPRDGVATGASFGLHISLDFQAVGPRFAARFARWAEGLCWSLEPRRPSRKGGDCRQASKPTTNLNYSNEYSSRGGGAVQRGIEFLD